ncbi:MAG TPA: TRAP transporter large permease subunit [Rhodocyclaceae bacterium]|nr:TRAP transporter large permease subunit [Rhodocyclaceae bacterium]HRQ46850.1 TRAP transporter large permease subunit [Rhodocyclaceae bacterium]
MIEFLSANIAPVMFGAVVVFLLSGFPVAFSLAACGLLFGFIGIELGLLPATLFHALPLRVFGIIQNETLLAIPFFTLMGLILERSGMAEDLLDTVGQVFGPVRGGLALAVVFVGALLAATTGVVAASVISMGLISLPIMLRYGYGRSIATGVITASGTLAQALPPSIVLIVMADQLGRSVGDMYRGAFIPAFMLIGAYTLYVILLATFKPRLLPALPPEALKFREPNGSSGMRSLIVLMALLVTIATLFGHYYDAILSTFKGIETSAPLDETLVMSLTVGTALGLSLAGANRLLKLGLLSVIAERVVFVLIPPLALIFLVLGTIFLGIATPTEGGAMGAVGAMIMAVARGRLDYKRVREALQSTAKLSVFVMFILIGATVFSFTFTAVDGKEWIEHLFDKLPGGQIGFLIFVNAMIFFLGFFLDFFEIAFILIPLLAPVAVNLNIDLIWFGILIALNLQTSFLTPPFGFALFYLRSVSPVSAFVDRVTKKRIEGVRTTDIYRGSIPFVLIQIIVLALLIAFPDLVTGSLDPGIEVDLDTIEIPRATDDAEWGSGGGAWN